MSKSTKVADQLPVISPQALFALGVEDVAYVKSVYKDGRKFYAVVAADGTEMQTFADRDVAFAACRQNDLEPLSVH